MSLFSTTTNNTNNCKNCTEEGFTSPRSFLCTECSSDLCCYHGQKHAKENPDHNVSSVSTTSSSLFGGSFNGSNNNSSGGIFGSLSGNGSSAVTSSIFGGSWSSSTSSGDSNNSSLFGGSSTSSIFGSSNSGVSSGSAFGAASLQNDIIEDINKQRLDIIANFDRDRELLFTNFMQRRSHIPVLRDCKLILVGEPCGKSTYVKKLISGEFDMRYIATLGVEVNVKKFETTHGDISFKIWDTAGQEKFGGLRDGYYISSDCAIIMFDSQSSFKSVYSWYRDVVRVCENIPIVLCLNRSDLLSEEDLQSLRAKAYSFCVTKSVLNYFELSNKNDLNLEDPFEYLSKALLKDNQVSFLSKIKKKQESAFHQKLQETLHETDANIKIQE